MPSPRFSHRLRFGRLAAAAAVLAFVAGPLAVLAQVSTNSPEFTNLPAQFNLGTSTDVRQVIINIVRIILGFLGLLAVLIIMYGGWLWMTAAGNEDRLTRAKRVLVNGLIGLLIILLSFAIVSYIIWIFWQATGGGGGQSCVGQAVGTTRPCQGQPPDFCPGTETCQSDFTWSACNAPLSCPVVFQVTRFFPTPSPPAPRNTTVAVFFTKDVDPNSVSAANLTIVDQSNSNPVSGTVTLNQTDKRRVDFVPTAACPPPNASLKCFDVSTFTVTAHNGPTGLKSTDGDELDCQISPCTGDFTTNNVIDTTPPTVRITAPPAQVPESLNVAFTAYGTDNAGLKQICLAGYRLVCSNNATQPCARDLDCGSGNTCVPENTPSAALQGAVAGVFCAPPPTPNDILGYNAATAWSTTGLMGRMYSLKATAEDSPGFKSADTECVKVLPAHCFNTDANGQPLKDANETGPNCGGPDPASPDYCGACAGEQCNSAKIAACTINNTDCAAGLACDTTTDRCVPLPVITAVIPGNGAPNNFVTIWGRNFGAAPGQVTFLGSANGGSDVTASLPAICSANQTWTDTQIIVVVPSGVNGANPIPFSSPLQVTTAGSLQDRTDDSNGPKVPDFIVNSKVRPGLCAVTLVNPTDKACPDTATKFLGTNFSPPYDPANHFALFGSVPGVVFNPAKWTATTLEAAIPNIQPATVGARVQTTVGTCDGGPNDGAACTTDSGCGAGGTCGLKSNPVNFATTLCAAGPRVDSLDPARGPVGQVVTVFGANFGSRPGTVWFNDATCAGGGNAGQACTADTDCPASTCVQVSGKIAAELPNPAQCRAQGLWQDKQIVVKVPAALSQTPLPRNIPVYVERSDTATSNKDKMFNLNNDPLSPALYCLDPDNGPVGWEVNLYGERLGPDKFSGVVRFYNNQDVLSAAIDSWNADGSERTIIGANVPVGSETGPVRVVMNNKVCTLDRAHACVGNGDCRLPLPSDVGPCQAGQCRRQPGVACASDNDCKQGATADLGPCVDNASNGLNFTVGSCTASSECSPGACTVTGASCTQDADCPGGAGDTCRWPRECCPDITTNVGICRPSGTCPVLNMKQASYRWQFSTGNTVPPFGVVEQQYCAVSNLLQNGNFDAGLSQWVGDGTVQAE